MPKIANDLEVAFSKMKSFLDTKQRGSVLTYNEIMTTTGLQNPYRLRYRINCYFRERGCAMRPVDKLGWRIVTNLEQLTTEDARKHKKVINSMRDRFENLVGANSSDPEVPQPVRRVRDHHIQHIGSQLARETVAQHEAALILGVPPPRPRIK